MARTLKDQAAIVGIGQTEFSKNSGRSELQLACEAVRAAIRDAGLEALRRRRHDHLHARHQRRHRDRALGRDRRAHLLQPHPARRRRRARHRAPGRAGGRDRRRRGGRLLPRAERALRAALQPGRRGRHRDQRPDPLELVHALRADDARQLGGDVHAALHARDRLQEQRPRAGGGLDAQARGQQPERVLLRQAAHARGAPELAHDRRPAAPLRLLPGDGRRLRLHRHHARARARPRAARRADPRHRAGGGRRPGGDDELLPRRPSPPSPRWTASRSRSTPPPGSGPRTRGRHHLRRLLLDRALAARELRASAGAARRRTS